MSHTWLKHNETGGTWQCPDDAVEAFKVRGWEPCDPPETDDSHLYDKPPAKPEPQPRKAASGRTKEKE